MTGTDFPYNNTLDNQSQAKNKKKVKNNYLR